MRVTLPYAKWFAHKGAKILGTTAQKYPGGQSKRRHTENFSAVVRKNAVFSDYFFAHKGAKKVAIRRLYLYFLCFLKSSVYGAPKVGHLAQKILCIRRTNISAPDAQTNLRTTAQNF